MQTTTKNERAIRPKTVVPSSEQSNVENSNSAPINLVIAQLTEQIKRENENIADMMKRQRELRQQLLKAQEESLAAIRRHTS